MKEIKDFQLTNDLLDKIVGGKVGAQNLTFTGENAAEEAAKATLYGCGCGCSGRNGGGGGSGLVLETI